jgi:cyanophycin synthetase
MRLVEVRLLDGPNVYRLEPTVKVELAVGRRRSWFGQRSPGRHALVRLGAPVRAAAAPPPVRMLAAWVGRLHRLTGADAWLLGAEGLGGETRRLRGTRRLPVTVHRTSEPGHWVVAYPWREHERAEAIARAAWELTERGLDPARARGHGGSGSGSGSRTLARAIASVEQAGRAPATPPAWIRDHDRRVPVVSISGTNGKSTTTRMIGHILRTAGRRVGMTTSDGVHIDEVLVEEGDLTGPLGARRVLGDPGVDVAVLETARGGLVLRGMGYESNEAAVLTNVSSDHMDLHGLHTLPELAEVKQTIARVTRPEGVVVLNAEDDLLAATARQVRARVCLFALDGSRGRGGARVRRHLARGGRAMVVEDGWIVEREGPGDRRPIVRVEQVPATLLGIARHNVANAMAAGAAARALGASLEDVAAGLRDYAPTPDQAPGRLNLYHLGSRVVIVDFAHNEAGVNVALDVAEGLAGRPDERRGRAWVSAVVGTAGDRPDDTLQAIGRTAAARADEVAIKETLPYLRGRTRESVVGEILAGMRDAGRHPRDVPIYEDEASAVRAELTDASRVAGGPRPGVLLVLCHAGRKEVVSALEELGFRLVMPAGLPALRGALTGRGAQPSGTSSSPGCATAMPGPRS